MEIALALGSRTDFMWAIQQSTLSKGVVLKK
jgi:hypothetical protein